MQAENKELLLSKAKLEAANKELLLNKTKLEASLEDALLGKVPGAKKHGEEKNAKKKNRYGDDFIVPFPYRQCSGLKINR